MSHARQALVVAAWEFGRLFKWRDQVMGLLIFLAIGAAGYGVGRLAISSGPTFTVGVSGMEASDLAVLAGDASRLRFVAVPPGTSGAAAFAQGELHGVLTRTSAGAFELLVDRDPRYRTELSARLDELVRRERLEARGLTTAEFEQILTPAALVVRFTDPGRGSIGRAEQLVAGLSTAIVILAVFMGMAYLLSGITGEKQLRVTESIVSIIPPQAWIDGKILGIAAYSLVNVANMAVGMAFVAIAARLAWGFDLPEAAARPGILLLLVVFCALALLLWNSAFAAFAATIDDPNTSARTSVMFVPMLFVGLACWVVLRDPDSTLARALGLFPLTSGPALPVRAILSHVGPLEALVSAVLLAATIWLFRRAAGRIFEVGMLMYGQEPTWRELARWARTPSRSTR